MQEKEFCGTLSLYLEFFDVCGMYSSGHFEAPPSYLIVGYWVRIKRIKDADMLNAGSPLQLFVNVEKVFGQHFENYHSIFRSFFRSETRARMEKVLGVLVQFAIVEWENIMIIIIQ